MVGLRKIQNHLERLYEVSIDHDVDRYLITDPGLARRLDAGPGAREAPEKLLVQQEEDGLSLALYLDQTLLDALAADDPSENLHDGNLASFWHALEGVSHFLYLVWNAGYGRSVTRLELELQAEVDKFIMAALLISRQRGGRFPSSLHRRLFANPVFDEALNHSELSRYHTANRYAGRYCEELQRRFLRQGRGGGSVIKELRQFYRLMHRRKLERIRAMN